MFFAVFIGLVASGQRGGDTFFSNPWLSWSILLAAGTAVAAGGAGLICILTHRERSVAVLATIVLGLLVLAWMIVEVSAPH
ncbi:hypothetical protein HQ535_08735 [bacterium]|nr:hypothetical protein [bacterium]